MAKGAKGKDMNKKQQDKAKSSMVVDKTFGMKNKNKSKKVQKYIQNVQHAAQNRFTDRKEEKAKKEAQSRKEAKKAHEAEMAALFQVVEDKKPKKDKFAADVEAAPAEESVDDTAAFLEEMGISVPKADGRRKKARERRTAEANAKEEERLRKLAERGGKTIEERLEVIRKGLQLDAPVNKDTFQVWKKERDERRKKQLEQELEQAKKNTKKDGKGKSQLTGRQLFEFHKSLFVDDAEAGGADQYKKEFDDAEDAFKTADGGAAGEGAPAEGAPAESAVAKAEAAAEAPSNSTTAAPESTLDGVDESVFLAENLDDLDDLPSDDDE